jgi:hypothetical protein
MTKVSRPPVHGAAAKAARKERLRKSETADLDAALEDSFPASDPPSMTQPRTRVGAPQRRDLSKPAPRRRQK